MSDQPDYDSPWKDTLERFFFDFVGFFFPDVHAGIDWDTDICLRGGKKNEIYQECRRDGYGKRWNSFACTAMFIQMQINRQSCWRKL